MTSKEKEKYNLLLDALLREKELQLKSIKNKRQWCDREISYLENCIQTIKDTYKL